MQGLVSCQKCGYAFARTSTQTTARKIHYYKCIGFDSWRKLGGPVCDNGRFVRQDMLDQIVWAEVIRLLEEPTFIQTELDLRLAVARSSDPAQKRVQNLQRELAQEIKQQLGMRKHDPVPQTGEWLQSVVQGYFNYYAVPGNLDSLGLFRERVLRYWGHSLKRRSQTRRYAWVRRLKLAAQWLPPPRVLHPWSFDHFAATHPR